MDVGDDANRVETHRADLGEQASSSSHRFRNIVHLDVVDSTNRYVYDEALRGAEEGLVVVADHQFAGRGRRGRSWQAPRAGSLLCSVLFRPRFPPEYLPLVSFAVALSALEAIEREVGLVAMLKWPNDLVDGEAKFGGILAEMVPTQRGGVALVVGIGINLAWPADFAVEFEPDQSPYKVTTVELASSRTVDRDLLLSGLLDALARHYDALGCTQGRSELIETYRSRCVSLGQDVRVVLPESSFVARALRVDEDGRLVVRRADEEITLAAADIVHLRSSADRNDEASLEGPKERHPK